MKKELREFLEELIYNKYINIQMGQENTVDIDYIIERITEILNKNKEGF